MPAAPPPLPKSQPFFKKRHLTMLKLFGVGGLILVMLIPLLMIQGVLNDRMARRNEAVDDITASWGKDQNIIGPILVVPYLHHGTVVRSVTLPDGRVETREVAETTVAYAYFLPDTLEVTGDLQTQTLHRGIYDAVVFRGMINVSGKFPVPDMAALKIDPKDVLWKDAAVTLAVSDLRGTRESLMLDWGGKKIQLQPGSQLPGYTSGVTAPLANDQPIAAPMTFSIALDLNGSSGIFFAPFGVQNVVALKSTCPDPGFRGAFLPSDRNVRSDGFEATWKVSYYGRDYPQRWKSRAGRERFTTLAVSNSLFGTQFLRVLDAYRYVERSIKYGVFFFVLVFTTFFLFEVTAKQQPHPLQYLMVGAALCLFYLALLSASEFIGFTASDAAATVHGTGLITGYCSYFLGRGARTLMVRGGLIGVYTFLYFTLLNQNYALLMGTVALFILLRIVM